MTRPALGAAEWEAANGDFLAASLAWLRLLLQRRRDPAEQPPSPPPSRTAAENGPPLRTRRARITPTRLPVRASISDDEIANAAARVAHTEQCTPPPALVELAARLGLSRFERDILLLCAALDLDPSVADLCARAHGNDHMRYPTFGLALEMLPDPAWDAVAPRGGLRYWKLVEITQRSGEGLISAALRADERIVNYVKGLNDLDDRLSPVVTSLDSSAAAQLPDSQQVLAQRIEREWTLGPTGTPTVQLAGLDPAGKRLVAAHAARRCGLLAYRLPADLIPTQPTDLDNLARLWERESALLPVALYIDAEDIDDENAAARTPISRFLTRIGGQCALAVRESWSDVGRGSVVLDVEAPSATERAEAWQPRWPRAPDMGAIDALSAQFALQICDIAEIALDVRRFRRRVARMPGADPPPP